MAAKLGGREVQDLCVELKVLVDKIKSLEGDERDDAITDLLKRHPWVKYNERMQTFTIDGEEWQVASVNASVNPRAMQFYVRGECKRKEMQVPPGYKLTNDDTTYACTFDETAADLAEMLRNYLPRGFTQFSFTKAGEAQGRCVVRGLNKFTGLTAADEDEESEASNNKALFFAGGVSYRDAETLALSTKSNGENAKGTLRHIGGVWWVLAGSKNTCMACPVSLDVDKEVPQIANVPGPTILAYMHAWARARIADGSFDECAEIIDKNRYILLFEINQHTHEHIFPIPETYIEGFAIRDQRGMAIDPLETFAFFEKYGFPCVHMELRPGSEIDNVVAEVRARRNCEGVVVYFVHNGAVVGLLKVKSDYYVLARATRQKFWRLVDDLMRIAKKSKDPKDLEITDEMLESLRKSTLKRMWGMTQLPEHETHAREWAKYASAFIDDWAEMFRGLATYDQKMAALVQAKAKFGTLYAEYGAKVGARLDPVLLPSGPRLTVADPPEGGVPVEEGDEPEE